MDEEIPDPELHSEGRDQCADLQDTFPDMSALTYIISLLMRRTLETAQQVFEPLCSRSLDIEP